MRAVPPAAAVSVATPFALSRSKSNVMTACLSPDTREPSDPSVTVKVTVRVSGAAKTGRASMVKDNSGDLKELEPDVANAALFAST